MTNMYFIILILILANIELYLLISHTIPLLVLVQIQTGVIYRAYTPNNVTLHSARAIIVGHARLHMGGTLNAACWGM